VRVAVIGATGVVGETILRVLEERKVPVDALLGYASRERDDALTFHGASLPVVAASAARIIADRPHVAFFASSDDASAEMANALAAAGIIVIDNSATFRLDPDCPLVVPEVNAHAIAPEHMIFPVGNCTAIVLCVGLAPIERAVGLRAVRVSTYQAVSGAGRAGLDALAGEEAGKAPDGTFAAPILHNVVPQVGSFSGVGNNGEEDKVAQETRKTLNRPDLHVAATCVRVPVRRAHSETVFFETERPTSVEELGDALAAAKGVIFHDRGIVTPLDVENTDVVHVARLRGETENDDTRFQMWVVGDQLRKGAATNGVQILELLVEQGRFATAAAR
jgi:aspartate-semialdehyde dehydrogenase